MYTLIATAKLNDIDPQAWPKLNDIDPQAWLADIIARISDLPASRLPELLPWNWNAAKQGAVKAA